MDDQERRQVRAMWVVYRTYPIISMAHAPTCNVIILAICPNEATAKRYLTIDPRCHYSVAAIDAGEEAYMTAP